MNHWKAAQYELTSTKTNIYLFVPANRKTFEKTYKHISMHRGKLQEHCADANILMRGKVEAGKQ